MLQDLFDTTSDLIQIFGVDGTLRLVNRAWCERLGWSEAEAIGRNVFELIAPDCQEHCQQVFQALLSGQVGTPIDCAFLSRDGRRISLEGQLSVAWVDGQPVEVRGILRDISDRRQAQEELQALNASLEVRVRERTQALEIAQARLEEAQRLASVGHWEMDLVSGALHWSDEICRISGFDPKGVTPSYALFLDTVHPEDRDRMQAAYHESLVTHQPVHLRYRLRRTDGSVRTIDARWTTEFDGEGRPLRSIGTSQDVTDFAAAEESLRLAAQVFHSAAEGIFLTDPDGVILDVNQALCQITGYSRQELLGQTPRLFKSGCHELEFYQQMWAELLRLGTWSGEIVNRARDGSAQDMLETISVVRDEQGAITNYVAMLSDIRQMKQQQRQLERLALYDGLTGLPNRILLAQRLQRSLAAVRSEGGTIAIGYVDLDGFKEINDRHGHEAGDSLLQTLAQRMKQVLGPEHLVARLGGDEFLMILHGIAPGQRELPLVQRLLDELVQPVIWNEISLEITASIGVTFCSASAGSQDADELLRIADAAMYEAKRQGKNRYWLNPPVAPA